MTYHLKFTNPYGERFFFCNFGTQWPSHPERRLIERTSADPEEAKQFPSEEEANAAHVTAGSPTGWVVEGGS